MNLAKAQISLTLALTLASVFSAGAAPTVEVLARGLQHPWAVAFWPMGAFWSPSDQDVCAWSTPAVGSASRSKACRRSMQWARADCLT